MPDILVFLIALGAAYLAGSTPFAVIISKCMGLDDPRSYGSGNPGATNVLRTGNKKAALLTLIGDALKGTLVVLLARQFSTSVALIACVSLAVFLGHVFSVFLRFKGGKGVATAAGVLFGLDWRIGLATLGIWLAIAIITRYSSLSAICAAIAAPVIAHLVLGQPWIDATTCVMAVVLVWRHQSNIRKLLAGEESRIGQKKNQPAA